jgi:hypothetical protein
MGGTKINLALALRLAIIQNVSRVVVALSSSYMLYSMHACMRTSKPCMKVFFRMYRKTQTPVQDHLEDKYLQEGLQRGHCPFN